MLAVLGDILFDLAVAALVTLVCHIADLAIRLVWVTYRRFFL